ncbi:tRNA lysidine(34) synthetase TilS [Candidatus Aerophobetes bacterium]|nr:tRNA lysidine(34) synthetase TilS [Candidatus Aerophobetes bacterium]
MAEDYLLHKVESTIHQFNMLSKDSRIVVGVSGGPDSTALLHLLCRLRKKYNLTLFAAHLNHGIRAIEAKEDEKWVKVFTRELEVPLTVDVMDVPVLAKEKGASLETVAREVRYNFLEHLASKVQADKIAVGHTASDQVETVLMRLIRGSGIDGLSGIAPVRGKVIRPLIRTFRWEIEKYCQIYNLSPRKDSSNEDAQFLRNKIRLELIPYLCTHYNPRVVEALYRSADLLEVDKDFLDKFTQKIERKIIKKKTGREIVVNGRTLFKLHLCLQRRVIRQILEKLKGDLEGIEYSHIEQILNLKEAEGSKLTYLPGKLTVLRQYDELILKKGEEKLSAFFSYLNVPGETKVPELTMIFKAKILSKPPARFLKNSHQAFFDLDKIPGSLYVCPRREGDKFVPLGMKEKKKIKDFFIDMKVPRFERDKIPILFSEGEIVWIVGYRIDDRFKLSEDSKKILHVKATSYA